ncbi:MULTISPECIES: hypothetical protein [Alteromonadaceae]|uniref:Uncharacterized protein n=1 Tax=Brumicola blandensis TaxID=3075611 RepID=A0AAW8QZ67_9ALTE|nr:MULTISPECIES: hypothetical protein [unclassified Alteromonas]MDT0582453.1 hypothetical protein [Alteromonas sp. W409]MDT0628676.1 hypothetical protein [Alteromonas sp. W364]
MQKHTSNSSLMLRFLLLISLAFNQGLGLASSSTAMSAMQSFASDDVLAICTGKSVKWISAYVYFASGEVLEVEAPAATPENLHEVSCVLAQLADQPNSLENTQSVSVNVAGHTPLFYTLVSFSTTSTQTLNLARAPPILFANSFPK